MAACCIVRISIENKKFVFIFVLIFNQDPTSVPFRMMAALSVICLISRLESLACILAMKASPLVDVTGVYGYGILISNQ